MATSGTCEGVTWSGGDATCDTDITYFIANSVLVINADGVTISGSVTVGKRLLISVPSGVTNLNIDGIIAKDDASSGFAGLEVQSTSTITFSGNSFFNTIYNYDCDLILAGNGSVTVNDEISVTSFSSSLTISNTGTITGNISSTNDNPITISADSNLIGNIFAMSGNVIINGTLTGSIAVTSYDSRRNNGVIINNMGTVTGNLYLVNNVTFTNNSGSFDGTQYGGAGGTALVKLAKVTNIQPTNISYQQTQISWDTVAGALQYYVKKTCTRDGNAYYEELNTSKNFATIDIYCDVSKPINVQVTAVYYNSDSPGDQGEASDAFTVPYLPYTTASAVRDIKVFYVDSTTVKITWSAPLTLGSPALNNYMFYIYSGPLLGTISNCSPLTYDVTHMFALTTNTEVVCTNLDDAENYTFGITPVYFNSSPLDSVGGTSVTDNFTFYSDGTGLDAAPPVDPPQTTVVNKIPIYRAAKYQGGYFYTFNLEEYKSAVNFDMRLESGPNGEYPAFYATDASTPGAVPIYRSAKLSGDGYFYTADPDEHAVTPQYNMRQETTDFYVMPASSSLYGEIPLYRGAHLTSHGNGNKGYIYTANWDEYVSALPANGYRQENEVFRVISN